MANTDKFEKCIDIGSNGEAIFYKHMKKYKNLQSIIDVSNNSHFQKLDVDFIITLKDGTEYWVEVKYDSKTDGSKELHFEPTGNIVFETKSNGNIGCLARSVADYVFYITTQYIYSFNLNKMRGYIKLYQPKEIPMGDGAMGYVLNKEKLIDAKVLKVVDKIGSME